MIALDKEVGEPPGTSGRGSAEDRGRRNGGRESATEELP